MVAARCGVLLLEQVHGRTDQVGRRVGTGRRVTRETAAKKPEWRSGATSGRCTRANDIVSLVNMVQKVVLYSSRS
jgi:hypothetical protein